MSVETVKNAMPLHKGISIAVIIALFCSASAFAAETTRVSTLPDGSEPTSDSADSYISADGQVVTFFSFAQDLDPRSTPSVGAETFIYERRTGVTDRVGIASDGSDADAFNGNSSLSADGGIVVFSTEATNMVAGDTNGVEDVFVRDRVNGTTERISVSSLGVEGNATSRVALDSGDTINVVSADGRYVVFESRANNLVPNDVNGLTDIFLRDRVAGTTERVSVSQAFNGVDANGGSFRPTISADGQFVMYLSNATNLDPRSTTGIFDFYVLDRQSQFTEKVSLSSLSEDANDVSLFGSISGDGRYVVFDSRATNLVPDDTNESTDIFLRDRQNGQTTRISVASDGTQATNFSSLPHISENGRYVVFRSPANNLVVGDTNDRTDVFRHDRITGITERVSVATSGGQISGSSFEPAISADGRYVTFNSSSDELVEGDSTGDFDVFVRDMGTECDISDAANQFTLITGRFEMLSLPCEPPAGTTINDLFGDDIAGGYRDAAANTGTWIVFTFDSTTNSYVDPGPSGTLSIGQGFWITQVTGSEVSLDLPQGSSGVSSNYTARGACEGTLGCQNIPLSGASHPIDPITNQPSQTLVGLVGNPFNDTNGILFDDMRVSTETGPCSLANSGCTLDQSTLASQGGADVLGNVMFAYDSDLPNSNGGIGDYVQLTSGSVLSSWASYWVFELPSAVGNSPVLHFPDNR